MGLSRPLDAALLLGTGLTMSLGHCLGMCGPLLGALGAAQRHAGTGRGGLVLAQTLHHLGRISSYMLIGMAVAFAGSGARLAGQRLQDILAVAIGAIMIGLATGLLGWLPLGSLADGGSFTRTMIRAATALRQAGGSGSWFLTGMANGLLPCGPVYAIAIGAASASPPAGAMAMALFGLGTTPALLLFVFGLDRLRPRARRLFQRLAATLILLIGVQLVCRGAASLGWIGHFRIGQVVLW